MNADRITHPLLRAASRNPFLTSLAGSVLLWLCFPPVAWWPLAWIATIPFVALIAVPEFQAARPLRSIWFSGWLYWAAASYYITIPHPALWIAWILLFSYLSVYPLLFVWIARKLVHGLGVSVLLAAPLVFTALEWVRAHALSGFGFSMLANSQYLRPGILQICDVGGGYGLSFLMVAFAAAIFLFLAHGRRLALGVSVAIVLVIAGYGWVRLDQFVATAGETLDVAIVQGNIDTRFPRSAEEMRTYQQQRFTEYLHLQQTWQRDNDWPVPDLVIWPEGKYPIPYVLPGGGQPEEEMRRDFRLFYRLLYEELVAAKDRGATPQLPLMIVGAGTLDPARQQSFNSALLLENEGQVLDTYHKMHLVPFGEFIPFGEWFPFLARLTPIGSGFEAGQRPAGFRVGDLVGVPCVCCESAVTHRIRENVTYLRALDREPDFLVNVTDDGWFYGHAVLDHHLACNVMRAVENRKPMIVAANTGISAVIQSTGEIVRQGPRREAAILDVSMELKPARSLYSFVGDWPVIAMTILCVAGILVPVRRSGTVEPPVDEPV
jgi:apolipoprotein N-acyltransferase